MPPKAADKKPASKAPAASKAPVEKKDAGKKTAASGEKKKRSKTRKETYSSYIYKGKSLPSFCSHPAPQARPTSLRARLTILACLHAHAHTQAMPCFFLQHDPLGHSLLVIVY
jgi:hypothetical protein